MSRLLTASTSRLRPALAPLTVIGLVALWLAPAASAQVPTLTVEQITQRPETWIGAWPSAPFWTDAGDYAYFEWNPRGEMPADSLFRVPAAGGVPERVPAAERRALPPRFDGWHAEAGAYSADRRRHVFERGGDLFVYHLDDDRLERLTQTTARESSPAFLADGSVVYRQGDDLYRIAEGGAVRQVADVREGRETPEPESSEQAAYLRDQQRRLFDVIRERVRLDSLGEAEGERDREALGLPTPIYTGDRALWTLALDPTGRFVTYTLASKDRPDPTLMVDYVTETGVAAEIKARPKVGAVRGGVALFVQDTDRDTTYQIDLATLPGAYDAADYARERGETADSSRGLVPWGPYWSPDGRTAIVDVRTVDNKDRWIARLNAETGALTSLDRQRDEAWIAGPGINWGGGPSAVGWTADGRRFWFQSERTGWSHLYAVDPVTGAVDALTEGAFEVESPTLSRDGQTWFFQSSEGDLGQRHVYRMPAGRDGFAQRERLTDGVGRWDFALAPSGNRLALLYSQAAAPPEVYLQDAAPGAEPERVTESTTAAWRAYPWRDAEIVEVPASDGALVPARIYRPREGVTPNGGAVLFVHGAGYLQNAHRWWSSYAREYQFHNLLADLGYVVLDLDYRASAGYGRDWRTAVYRHMGGRDLQDYVDASDYLGREFGIDPERVTIYGGSYGGFLTLMALFTEPDHFAGGAALRSVTDWAHYNDTYTRNILNTPLQDPDAYRRSSPIEFADGLDDPLLMTHGLVDDNVQPQDIFRLSQRLIELGKRDWELAVAPVEPHAYAEPTSWADKLARVLDLVEHTAGPERADGSEG
ncbi:prolyl oligopeptidase family serine peptidase [Rubrivirga litoralis]|uniref:Prolyl oligopeptidase family serine peptidase n=1 Tax=Rubrivirga litoralis TaxID=3075598 RepID=A0ABU3BNW4_9BACT|nr:prolyl oligopeptidase family serine peptidase [Rubrivirga sp. F394]MDT0630992.1 prolyl oligopeptidase family serine peptidase [Rubrivirga sp. F394]